MKRRAERTAQFNAVRATIKAAVESTVQTAILHDEMFTSALEALAEAHEAAQAAESEGGADVTPNEMLGIALAVVVPALQKFLLPTIPRDTIQAIAAALEIGSDRLEDIRTQAAAIIDKAGDVSDAVLGMLEE